jgi:ribonucleoside-diphosphate reductase subunit M2
VLAFFASSDGIINENLAARFSGEVQIPEARAFYAFQMAIESVHGEAYSLMIDSLVDDTFEKAKLFKAIDTIPCVQRKAQWAEKWITSSTNFATRLVAFACVEGIFFSGSFCSIFWLKKRGLMPGLTLSNQLIARDEGMHRDFACLLYRNYIKNKLPKQDLYAMLDEAIQIEKEFVCECLPVRLIGMNQTLMCQYIDYVAEHLLLNLTGETRKKTENPFDWMVYISLENKTNFFEHRPTEYSKAGTESSISFHDEF